MKKKVMDQTLAWILAVVLAGAVYGGGYGVIKVMAKRAPDMGHNEGHGDAHGSGHGSEHGDSHEAASHGGEHAEGHGGNDHGDKSPGDGHETASHETNSHGDGEHGANDHGTASDHGNQHEEKPKDESHDKKAPAGHGTHWSYEGNDGPEHWGDLDPNYRLCKTGKEQSPIDIVNASEKNSFPKIEFHYDDSIVSLINNGHTIQANYKPGNYIVVGEKRFDLLQFHFHTPSEHKINGIPYDMELHFVHKDDEGKLGVVGVMIEQGEANAKFARLWNHMPAKANQTSTDFRFNAAAVLPKDRDYYTYPGSLTTPPCSEGVKWMVMTRPIKMSGKAIDQFAGIFKFNARPVQPLFERRIFQPVAH